MENTNRGESEKKQFLQKIILENVTVANKPTKTLELVALLAQTPLTTRDGLNVYEHSGQLCTVKPVNRVAAILDAETIKINIKGVYDCTSTENRDQMVLNLVTKIKNTTRSYKHPLMLICDNKMLDPLLTYRQNNVKTGDTINVVEDVSRLATNTMAPTDEGILVKDEIAALKRPRPDVNDGGPYQYVVLRFQSNDAYLHGLLETSSNMYIGFKQNASRPVVKKK